MASKSVIPPPAASADKPPPAFQAAPASDPAMFRTQFACVTLNMRDRIRFLNFPDDVVQSMSPVIKSAWPNGIQDTRRYGKSQEIKVHGNPWRLDRSGDDRARRLTRCILEALYDKGWVLQGAVDLSKKQRGKDALLFRYQSPPPAPCEWISVSLDQRDRLKIVDPPPRDIVQALLIAYGSSVSRSDLSSGHFEIKFHGTPWWPSGEETVQTPFILMTLLETLERFGFTMYTGLNQQNSGEGHDTDVIVFHRQKDWVPGMPVWHR